MVTRLTESLALPLRERNELLLKAGYAPPYRPAPGHLGFAVPPKLRAGDVLLNLITTITSFATAADVTVSELRLEAFLPADAPTAAVLQAAALRDHAKLGP